MTELQTETVVAPPGARVVSQWTAREVKFLRENYAKLSKQELLDALPHKWKGIKYQAYKQKLYRVGRSQPKSDHPIIAALVDLRLKKGMTVKRLAQLAGVDRGIIFKWERGQLPTLARLEKWAKALGARIDIIV